MLFLIMWAADFTVNFPVSVCRHIRPGEAKENPPPRYSKRRVHVTWETGWGDGQEDEVESSVTGAAESPPLGNNHYDETFYSAVPETGSAESQQVGGSDLTLIWFDSVCADRIWSDLIWYELILFDAWYALVWFGVTVLIWFDPIRFDLLGSDRFWSDLSWSDLLFKHNLRTHVIIRWSFPLTDRSTNEYSADTGLK